MTSSGWAESAAALGAASSGWAESAAVLSMTLSISNKEAEMRIWKKNQTIEELNRWMDETMSSALGIEIIDMTDRELVGKMPVDARTRQPFGLLHGGASCALAETLGSVASHLCLTSENSKAVGLTLAATHLRSATSGVVYGHARPVRLGRKIHAWDIEIVDETGALVCKVQFTTMIKE
jgi:1,4-dihydroxy-2-naphthoyl-CoA hydrolase